MEKNAMPGARRLRFGIIGCGLRGSLFARALSRMSDVTVAAAYDTRREVATKLATEVGAVAVERLDDLVRRDLDAVVIATPDGAHLEPVEAAAEQGLHSFLEKPVAMTSQDARRIRTAVRSAGVLCTVACLNRWHPAFAQALAAHQSGALGAVISQNARLSNSLIIPTKMLAWAAQSSPGWFLMPHSIDLIVAFAGIRAARVSAVGRRGLLASAGVDTWDGLQAVIDFDGGSMASVESLWVLPESSPSPVDFRYEVIGSKGAARIDDSVQGLELTTDKLGRPRALVQDMYGEIVGPNAQMIAAFVNSVRTGAACEPTLDAGVRVVELIESIHLSAAERTSILLPVSTA